MTEPLYLLDYEESFDLARAMRPELTREQYDEVWAQHLEFQKQRSLQ